MPTGWPIEPTMDVSARAASGDVAALDEDVARGCVYRLLARFLAAPPDAAALAVAAELEGGESEIGRAMSAPGPGRPGHRADPGTRRVRCAVLGPRARRARSLRVVLPDRFPLRSAARCRASGSGNSGRGANGSFERARGSYRHTVRGDGRSDRRRVRGRQPRPAATVLRPASGAMGGAVLRRHGAGTRFPPTMVRWARLAECSWISRLRRSRWQHEGSTMTIEASPGRQRGSQRAARVSQARGAGCRCGHGRCGRRCRACGRRRGGGGDDQQRLSRDGACAAGLRVGAVLTAGGRTGGRRC